MGIDGFIWGMKLTDEQWELIEPLLPATPKGPRGQGRPPAHSPRSILEGILWKLRSGARWELLPKCFPPYQTCHRWLQYWRKTGTFEKILFALANMALEQGKLGLDEGFIDATFAPAQKGGPW